MSTGGDNLISAEGFRFDLASIPRVFWFLVSPFELSIAAPLLHDFLYAAKATRPMGPSTRPGSTPARRPISSFDDHGDRRCSRLASQPGIPSGACLRLDRMAEGR